ncbi:hypothetical protein K439DRAFT_254394 [Ramaria rubella]|nr:hypothetical protein K439DRAFT_254394 [Ramaria rubella]
MPRCPCGCHKILSRRQVYTHLRQGAAKEYQVAAAATSGSHVLPTARYEDMDLDLSGIMSPNASQISPPMAPPLLPHLLLRFVFPCWIKKDHYTRTYEKTVFPYFL